ncbi:MAG: hypothetical protein WCX62_04490 [Synergistaceae bacterium]
MSNTIKIKSYVDVQEEYIADAAIKPGNLVKLDSDGKVTVFATNAGMVLPMFAVEDEFQGKTVTDAYAQGDVVQCWIPNRGDVVMGILDKGANVSIGDLLEATDDGTLRKLTIGSSASDGGAIVGVALEALNLTATAAVASFIKVRIK